MRTFQKILILLILNLFCVQQNGFAQDSIIVTKQVRHRFQPEPLKATMMAVVFPGLGQIYNRKYWKVPLVYGGFGGLFYAAGFNSSSYNKFMKAYQDFNDGIPQTKSYLSLIPDAVDDLTKDPVLQYDASNTSYWNDRLLQGLDYYKRYRDLSYIGIAGWYLISILDANVDASLFNYDISNNLDIVVVPVQLPLPGGYVGVGMSVTFKVTF